MAERTAQLAIYLTDAARVDAVMRDEEALALFAWFEGAPDGDVFVRRLPDMVVRMQKRHIIRMTIGRT